MDAGGGLTNRTLWQRLGDMLGRTWQRIKAVASLRSETAQHERSGDFTYDAFISYRRADGLLLAKWLRDRLKSYRLPGALRRELAADARGRDVVPLNVFRDEDYEGADEDFWQRFVVPNLQRSRHLIVISTPASFASRTDGQPNWLSREIDAFLELRRIDPRRRILLVLGPGAPEDHFPGRLDDPAFGDGIERPRWNWADLRSFSPETAGSWRMRFGLDDQFAKIVAALYDVPSELIPTLRREGVRRLVMILVSALVTVTVVAAAIGVLGIVAHQQRQQALRNEDQALQLLYVANMNLAARAFDDGNDVRGHELLNNPLLGSSASSTDRRNFVWRQLWRANHGETATLRGHNGTVSAVAISPNGKTLATVGGDAQVKLWDLATEREMKTFVTSEGAINTMAFSLDGTMLAAGHSLPVVTIWDLLRAVEPRQLGGNLGVVRSVAFTPGGKLAIANGESVVIWDRERAGEVGRCGGFGGAQAMAVAASPDNRTVAIGLRKHERGIDQSLKRSTSVQLCNLTNFTATMLLAREGPSVASLAYSPDGRTLAVSLEDDTVLVWDLAARREIRRHDARDPSVHRFSDSVESPRERETAAKVAFSRDGRILASVDGAGVTMRAAADGREISRLKGHVGLVTSVALSPDADTVVTGGEDGVAKVWKRSRTTGPDRWSAHKSAITSLAVSPDGETLSSGADDGSLKLWKIKTGQEMESIPGRRQPDPDAQVSALAAFSRDGELLAIAAGSNVTDRTFDPELVIRNRKNGTQLSRRVSGPIRALAFAPDGKTIIIGQSGQALLHAVGDGREIVLDEHAGGGVAALAVSPDGKTLAVAKGYFAGLWDLNTKLQITMLQEKSDITALAYSPDGRLLVAGLQDGGLKLWKAGRSGPLSVINGLATFSRLPGHAGSVTALAFSPDSQLLATAGADKLIKLWDMKTLQDAGTLQGHGAPIRAVVFAQDGMLLASGDSKGEVRLWRAAGDAEVTAHAPARK